VISLQSELLSQFEAQISRQQYCWLKAAESPFLCRICILRCAEILRSATGLKNAPVKEPDFFNDEAPNVANGKSIDLAIK
jgi:hypothetical protein